MDAPHRQRRDDITYRDANAAVHEAPWIDGDMTAQGGIFIALAEQAYGAHVLPYEQGLPR